MKKINKNIIKAIKKVSKYQTIIIALDESASTDNLLNDSFVKLLKKHSFKSKIKLIHFDGNVTSYKDISEYPYRIVGGGGTNYDSVIEYIKEKCSACGLLIYFTDGYGDLNKLNIPSYEVIMYLTHYTPYKHPFWVTTYRVLEEESSWLRKLWIKIANFAQELYYH